MEKETKSKTIALRVTEEEHKLIHEQAKANGFYTVSAYLFWLVKKYGKKQES